MDTSRQHPVNDAAHDPRACRGPGRRLRLVPRSDAAIVRQVDALDAAYSSHHGQLLRFLDALDDELVGLDPSNSRGAHEQISFIRVGLRCLADAIGELQAHANHLANDSGTDAPADPAGASG
jgi:hypothetical protein